MWLRAEPGERGAETIVYLASAPEAAALSGHYFVQCRPETPSRAAQNDDDARRLWAESLTLAGLE
jgi:retinol dehydrogenase 12